VELIPPALDSSPWLVTCGHDPSGFDHKDDCSFRCTWAMQHALGHHHTLARPKLDDPIFQINREAAADHIEELVVRLVLVPVVFPLYHPEPHDSIVHPAERLIVPPVGTGRDQRRHVDVLERTVFDVQVGRVWIRSCSGAFRHRDLAGGTLYDGLFRPRQRLPPIELAGSPCNDESAGPRLPEWVVDLAMDDDLFFAPVEAMQDSMHYWRQQQSGDDQEDQTSIQREPTRKKLPIRRLRRIDWPHPAEQHGSVQERITRSQSLIMLIPPHAETKREDDQYSSDAEMP
jgi:hypothetical protein